MASCCYRGMQNHHCDELWYFQVNKVNLWARLEQLVSSWASDRKVAGSNPD
jgi:hypothetical protein